MLVAVKKNVARTPHSGELLTKSGGNTYGTVVYNTEVT